MRVVIHVAEGDQVAGRFRCSGTHTGTWLGHPSTGRRLDVDEVSFSRVDGGRIVEVWGLEDTPSDSASPVPPDPADGRGPPRGAGTALGGASVAQYQPLACECDQAPQGEPKRFSM